MSAGRHIRLWILTAAACIAAAVLALSLTAASPPGNAHLPWWALVVGFAATELCVVHVHFRRSAHSLTLGELPLVLGLLFATPHEVMAGWLIGGGVVMALSRTPLLRLVFNLALLGLTVAVAGAVMHALAPTGGLEPRTWAAVTAGALASAAAAAALIGAAVRLSEGSLGLGRLARMIGMALVVAATNTSLALAGAVVLEADPWAAALLLVPLATVFAAYRAYVAERARHASLEFLYDVSRALAHAGDPAGALAGVLARARTTFRAEIGQACLFGDGATRTTLGPGEHLEVQAALPPPVAADIADLVATGARLLRAADAPPALRSHLEALGACEGMIAPLAGERETLGALLMAERTGVGGSFRRDELRLLETLASHTGAALASGRLGRQVSELRVLQEKLEHQAFHDPLTGLANRLLFHDRVTNALARRSGSAAVIYIDLDDFKTVNDTLGHEAGDALLLATGDRLREALRAADTPARLGGDEFAVLLVDIDEENARMVAGRILSSLRRPVQIGDRQVPVMASLGLAVAPCGSLAADALLRNADAAMYVAKHGGKHRFSVYSPAVAA